MLILIPTLVFPISNTESIFGHFWAEKVKSICLDVNWHTHTHTHTHTLSQGCYCYSEIRLVSRKLHSPLCLEAFTQSVDVIVRIYWKVWKQR